MNNIYVIATFKLKENSEEIRGKWKELSAIIDADIKKNADGLIFRDSIIDEEGNVQCILKWENLEKQEVFQKIMNERFKNEPELMEHFSKVADMATMKKQIFSVV